ncbi:hypothetical protein NDU88_011206 [Pleurodeles waltl]|uniref:Uncharacterized protein n=1 Tax=Pleurodeles waltl TaxID=8319 RepID=A0AAV7QWK0_PLEWA|nr:hypothetical protein NDU88_011206 [Pleurodeles waltl]
MLSPAATPDQRRSVTASQTPGPGAGTSPRGDTAQSARRSVTARCGYSPQQGGHRELSGVLDRSRGDSLTAAYPPELLVAPAERGQAGSCGVPGAAPQPTGPPPGPTAVWAQ